MKYSLNPETVKFNITEIYFVSDIDKQFTILPEDGSFFQFTFKVNRPVSENEHDALDMFLSYVNKVGYNLIEQTDCEDNVICLKFRSKYKTDIVDETIHNSYNIDYIEIFDDK